MKKILLSEVNRIHEIMGIKKSLIMEGQWPNNITELFSKMGISVDELISKLGKEYGPRYMESMANRIKGLFEKIILEVPEREFIIALTLKTFPNVVSEFVSKIEEGVLKNSPEELNGILKLFNNPKIPTIDIVDAFSKRTGIRLSPESGELWRTYKTNNPNSMTINKRINTIPIGQGRFEPSQTTSTINTTSPINNVTKPIESSLNGGKILEPHEFTVEGTNEGYKVYKGDKSNALGDIRQEARESIKDNYTKESVINGKKVFTLVNTTQRDAFARPGYASVSISLPLNTKLTIDDVLPALQSRLRMEQSRGGSMYNEYMGRR